MRVKIWRMRLQKLTLFRLIRPKLCEKKFQIFQIFENEIRKSLEINERKAEPEGLSRRGRALPVRLRWRMKVAGATAIELRSNPGELRRFATVSA